MGACFCIDARKHAKDDRALARNAIDGVDFSASAICQRHSRPIQPLRCPVCSLGGKNAASLANSNLCVFCIREHAHTFPQHSLTPFATDSLSLRAALAALVSENEDVTCKPLSSTDALADQSLLEGSPLVESCRRKVLAIQAGLDALTANAEAALIQLGANRDAGLELLSQTGDIADGDAASVAAVYAAGVEAVHAAAATKRAGLETELVDADAALSEAIEATTALSEAALVCDDAALTQQAVVLLRRLATAQTAVAAIPELPATSSFLVVEPAPVLGELLKDTPRTLALLALVWVNEAPKGLTCAQTAQLQAWLPPAGPSSPAAWEEVYRATTHGFGAAAFHTQCDGRARLLVLVQAREGGWLFGGFTAMGFYPPQRFITDPFAFIFSLTNSLGRPEKLESKRTGKDLWYHPMFSATFGSANGYDLCVCDNADVEANSWTNVGRTYALSASTGAHPMARGRQKGWHAAQVVAWVV